MFDLGRVGIINFVEMCLWITMPIRRKLSILDHGRALIWLNGGVKKKSCIIDINLRLSTLPMNFVVCIFQCSVHVAVFMWSRTFCD